MATSESIKVLYQNWKGEISWRNIKPIQVYWGSTDYHPEPQWLLEVMDLDKEAVRTFAFKDIILIREN